MEISASSSPGPAWDGDFWPLESSGVGWVGLPTSIKLGLVSRSARGPAMAKPTARARQAKMVEKRMVMEAMDGKV